MLANMGMISGTRSPRSPGCVVAYTPWWRARGDPCVLFNGGFTEYWACSAAISELYRGIPSDGASCRVTLRRDRAMVDFGVGLIPGRWALDCCCSITLCLPRLRCST